MASLIEPELRKEDSYNAHSLALSMPVIQQMSFLLIKAPHFNPHAVDNSSGDIHQADISN